jgi:GTP pyrophosphokinase
MAKCCQPIPPEPIIGFVTRGQGVTIHRRNCKQIENITEPERLIEADWGTESKTYPIPIVIKAYRRPGLIEDIVNLLRGQKISSPRAKTATASSITTVFLEVEITSLDQLNWLLQKFESLPNVVEASRQRWN